MVRSGIFHHSLSGIELDEFKDDEADGEDCGRLGAVGEKVMVPAVMGDGNKADIWDYAECSIVSDCGPEYLFLEYNTVLTDWQENEKENGKKNHDSAQETYTDRE